MKGKMARDEEKLPADLNHVAIVNHAVCLKMEKLEYNLRNKWTIECSSFPYSCH